MRHIFFLVFYASEAHIIYLTVSSSFLISFVMGGGGVGPGILKFFGPQMALAYLLNAISQGPKSSRIPGPTPSHLPS